MVGRSLAALALVAIACVVGRTAAAAAPRDPYLITAANLPAFQPMFLEVGGVDGRPVRVVQRVAQAQPTSVRWSPDGRLIAWATTSGIGVERADGTGRHVVARATCAPPCYVPSLAWSPDGRRLLVGGVGSGAGELRIVSASGGPAVTIAKTRPYVSYRAIGWTRDGRTIVFKRTFWPAGSARCCETDLIAARPDGSIRRRLFRAADGGIHDSPAASLSPDGSRLAFATDGADPADPRLAVVEVATGKLRRMKEVSAYTMEPVWSPDGRRLAVGRPTGDVVTMGSNGSAPRVIPSAGMPVDWSEAGITFVGPNGHVVLRGRDASVTPRLLFEGASRTRILAVDVR